MAKKTDRGALPHRTVQPREGEITTSGFNTGKLFVPVLYADAHMFAPDHLVLRCPTCGFGGVHIAGVGVVRRDDYREVSRDVVDEWNIQFSQRWKEVPGIERVRGDSLVLEIYCELDHVSVLELGSHKGFTSIRLTRMSDETE